MKIKNYAGLMAMAIYATSEKIPFYTGNSWRNDSKFDANEVKKARKKRKKNKK